MTAKNHTTEGAFAPESFTKSQTWGAHVMRSDRAGTLVQNHVSLMAVERHHPDISDAVRFDEMARVAVITKPVPRLDKRYAPDKFPRPLTDADILAFQEFFQLLGFTRITFDAAARALQQRAHENRFDPWRDYLNSLRWDHTPRLERLFNEYVGTPRSEYTAAIGRMFMISIVARAFEPGCKVDTMPVIVGEQGTRKSTLCRIIFGQYFTDNLPPLDRAQPKDVSIHLRGVAGAEIAELAAMSKAESAHLKAFVSRPSETYRPPHARLEVTEPRRCVFIGTTNEATFLRDATGARRFWPVPVAMVDTDAVTRDRDQLFAEAVTLYRQRVAWWPEAEFEAKHIKPQQEARFDEDAWSEVIRPYLAVRDRVILKDLAQEAIGIDPSRFGTADQRRLRSVLVALGWQNNGSRGAHGQRYYERKPATSTTASIHLAAE